MKKLIERESGDFFRQKVCTTYVDKRLEYFNQKIEGKTVLHYGCADWPIYNLNHNLHYLMCKTSDKIDGFDVDKETIEKMIDGKIFPEGSLYYELPDKKYDFILIPEVIEHINNVGLFLESILTNVKEDSEILITAPNAFAEYHINGIKDYQIASWETIHPDHNYWFSIYTLPNLIEKCFKEIGKEVVFTEIGFLENKTMIYTLFTLSDNLK